MSAPSPLQGRERLALLSVHALLSAALGASLMLMPLYLSHLGVTDAKALVGWSAAAYGAGVAVSFVATPLWGALGDRVGRRTMLLRAACGLALAQGLYAVADAPWHLVAARALQGAISGVGPALYAFAAARAGAERVGRTLGLLESVGSGGAMLGPLAASALVSLLGFRTAFATAAGACLGAAALVALVLGEAPRGAPADDADEDEEDDPLGDASVWVRLRAVGTSPAVRGVLLGALLVEVAHAAIELLYPILIVQLTPEEGLRAWLAGAVEAVGEGASLLMAPVLGRAADRWGAGRVVRACLAATGAVTLAAPLVRVGTWLLPVVALSDGAAAGVQPGVYARLSRAAPPGLTGTAVALGGSALRLGSALGVALAAPLVAGVGLSGGFWLAGGWLLALSAWAPWQGRAALPCAPGGAPVGKEPLG